MKHLNSKVEGLLNSLNQMDEKLREQNQNVQRLGSRIKLGNSSVEFDTLYVFFFFQFAE